MPMKTVSPVGKSGDKNGSTMVKLLAEYSGCDYHVNWGQAYGRYLAIYTGGNEWYAN